MTDAAPTKRPRLQTLDALRGFVMVLMAIDHASGAFNAGRLFTDSVHMYKAGTPLPAAQFLTRFMTHLCAPTFVFLAGASGALSAERRLAAGEPARSVDGHLFFRGFLIAALDPLWMSLGFTGGEMWICQVLYAIGTSMMAMALLRRLSTKLLVGGALFLMIAGELLVGGTLMLLHTDSPPLLVALLLTGGRFGKLVIAYSTLPWLAIMMLGWAFGRWLAFSPDAANRANGAPARKLLRWSGSALVAFVVLRAWNNYGNMRLLREDNSLVQWLHLSKYPPSLTYYTLLLGTTALLLAFSFTREAQGKPLPAQRMLTTLGRTAFFFYLLHVHLLEATAHLLGVDGKLGLWSAYVFGAAIVALLYPACVRYDAYKQAHPNGFTRYL